jgi:hypothetical protein
LNSLSIVNGGLIVLSSRYCRPQCSEDLVLSRHRIEIDNLNYGVLAKV